VPVFVGVAVGVKANVEVGVSVGVFVGVSVGVPVGVVVHSPTHIIEHLILVGHLMSLTQVDFSVLFMEDRVEVLIIQFIKELPLLVVL